MEQVNINEIFLEPKYRKYVQGHVFLSFVREFGDKYCKKLIDTATKLELMLQKLLLKD